VAAEALPEGQSGLHLGFVRPDRSDRVVTRRARHKCVRADGVQCDLDGVDLVAGVLDIQVRDRAGANNASTLTMVGTSYPAPAHSSAWLSSAMRGPDRPMRSSWCTTNRPSAERRMSNSTYSTPIATADRKAPQV